MELVNIGDTQRTRKKPETAYGTQITTSSKVSRHIPVLECPGHQVDIIDDRILDKNPLWFERGVKEAIYIQRHQLDHNRVV